MTVDKGYKTCNELKNITPQILEEWNRGTDLGEIKLVRRQIFLCCPLTDILISEKVCRGCPHNYGEASPREIYCVLAVKRVKGTRSRHKTREIEEP